MRIFFSADAHGSTELWKKWLYVCTTHNPDVLMLCGDLTAKSLVPIIKKGSKHTCHYFDKKWELETEDEIHKLETHLASAGVLSMRCTETEVAELQKNEAKVTQIIHDAILARMEEWLDLLVSRVDTRKVIAVVMPGNDDSLDIDEVIKSYQDRGVVYPLDQVVDLMGHELISLPDVTPTPWDTTREMTEEQLEKEIDKLMQDVKNPRQSIFNFHVPPYGTSLDQAPELTEDLKVKADFGEIFLSHVGSKAVRAALEKYQPLLGLHGHIHESDGIQKLGETTIINPGSEYEKGILRGYTIEIIDGRVDNYLRISG